MAHINPPYILKPNRRKPWYPPTEKKTSQ